MPASQPPFTKMELAPQPYAPWFTSDEDAASFAVLDHRSRTDGLTIEEALGEFSGSETESGIYVGPEHALRIGAAYACRRVIAEGVAKLPIRVAQVSYDHRGRKRTVTVPGHPVHGLLNDAPNDWMTPIEFVEYMIGVATFHPGSYCIVQRDALGRADELLPLIPGSASVDVDTFWRPTFRINGYGETWHLEPEAVFRLHGHMRDPWRGVSNIANAREAVALAAAIEASQARFHKNDLRPSGILTSSGTLKKEQRDAVQQQWRMTYGPNGDGGIAVLDGGWDFKAMMAEGSKSEVVDNRKFQITDICRFFGVFPTAIGHADGSQTFASVEAFLSAHAEHTLHPWVKRFEQRATLGLLTAEERRRGLRVDIDMDAAQRGTPKERVEFYEKAVKIFMLPNEARMREGMDPIDDPDMERVQIQRNNTGTLPSPPSVAHPQPAQDDAAPAEPAAKTLSEQLDALLGARRP